MKKNFPKKLQRRIQSVFIFSGFALISFAGVRLLLPSTFFEFKKNSSRPTYTVTPSISPSDYPEKANRIQKTNCTDFFASICKKKGRTNDVTGYVNSDLSGELQSLRVYENILRKHPDWNIDKIDEEMVRRIYTPAKVKRLVSAFDWSKNSILIWIKSYDPRILPLSDQNILIEKIKSVKLQLPPPASIYKDDPDLLTRTDVYYERLENNERRVRVGGAYLFAVKSWFNMIFTFSHELAHAIDPCELREFKQIIPAYKNLLTCFEKSQILNQEVSSHPNPNWCGHSDKLSETFADWVASQISAKALAKYEMEFDQTQIQQAAMNSIRDLCDDEVAHYEIPDTLNHPSPETRIQVIFGMNPYIRKILKCTDPPPSKTSYCQFGAYQKEK